MIFPDVNVLIYAADRNAKQHEEYRKWLDDTINNDEPLAISEIVLSSFIRIITSTKIFNNAFSMSEALIFADSLREIPNVKLVVPGASHWDIFKKLCLELNPKSGSVTDVYFAALAIEYDCELVSADKGFVRYPGLRWKHLAFLVSDDPQSSNKG